MKISEYAISKPMTTVMLTLSFLTLGAISLTRLPLEYAPDLSWPSMYINADYPSSSPEEIEREIARPIEEIMGTLSHVKSISSRSYASRCYVRLEFGFGTDMDLVSIHVRDRLDQIRNDLPDDLERISIRRWSTDNWPIVDYRLTWLGEDKAELLALYKSTILPRLRRIQGVGGVELEGVDEKVLRVEVNQDLLNTHHLDIRTLNRAIRANNVNTSAGYVRDASRRLSVRTLGEFEQVSQIRDLTLRSGIQLEDVADVTYDYPEKRWFERLDGHESVSLEVQKTSTANLVATAKAVNEEIMRIQEEVGHDKLRFHITRDQSVAVTDGLKNLAQSAIVGGMLAVIVIFIFLRSFRSTLIIGSAIPISVLCVFMIMYLLRQFFHASITLNLVSMMGLMVAIGMLVDPAVVALENIYRKRYDDGQDRRMAALEGAREIGMPVLAASLTTICVFIPLIFITESGSSLWMRDFAITVCISIIAALCVALTLVPLAGSRAFQSGGKRIDLCLKLGVAVLALGSLAYRVHAVGAQKASYWFRENVVWFLGGLSTVPIPAWIILGLLLVSVAYLYRRFGKVGIKVPYAQLVRATLRFRWSTVVAACVILGIGFYLYGKVEKQRFRWQSTRRVDFTVEVPRNYDVDDALALFQRVEEILLPRKAELGIEAIRTRFSNRRSNRISCYLISADKAKLTTDEVKKKVKELLPDDIPGVRFRAGRSRGNSSTGVGIEIKGRNPDVLAMLAEDIKLRMTDIEGAKEVETSLESGMEEVHVSINRARAQRYGLSPRQIATTIATALGSRGNSKFKTDDGEIDISLRLKEEDRATLEQLKNSTFQSDAGVLVSFGSLADFTLKNGPRSVERQDRMSTVDVYAGTEPADVMKVGREMQSRMAELPIPSGYSWRMDRRFRWMSQEAGDTNFTMIFAALLIYLIMASLFESYIHPFTIMFSICFAFTGVAVGLYALNIPMDSNAYYGLLILFGIVVNNGIVLIDHINRYRQQGYFRREAIVRGGQDRLRPILMTATTTVLGLTPLVIPMIYGTAEGHARRWGPIGLVVICGLIFSTFLTLIILPTIYSLMDDLAIYVKRVAAAARPS